MGGPGSGGSRHGAGAKRKGRRARWLGNDAGRRARGYAANTKSTAAGDSPARDCDQAATPAPAAADIDPSVTALVGLSGDEAAVWAYLAPLAQAAGTLTPATAVSFALLCRLVVMEREGAADVAMRATPSHRGLQTTLMQALSRFSLAPSGKPIDTPAEDPFENV